MTAGLFLLVAYSNPGYVTNEVVIGEEYIDDVENMKKYHDKTTQNMMLS